MIKNERQYRITKAQAEKFEQALARSLQPSAANSQLHPLILKAQQDALRSQLEELREQLKEYDALQSGKYSVFTLESFEELPRALIRARIALGMSQKELADRLEMKEQQLQRYEAAEYATASIDRIKEVVQALGIRVREEIFLPDRQVSLTTFFRRLKEIGFNRNFVLKRLLPRSVAARLEEQGSKKGHETLILEAASIVGRVLKMTVSSLLDNAPLQLDALAAGRARLKVPAGANPQRVTAYTMYAHHMALLALQATARMPKRPIPTDPLEVLRSIRSDCGDLSFKCALKYVWSLGVPVLPLGDRGTFHGACFRDDGNNIIVLKQQTASEDRWLHVLLHEFRHAGEQPEQKTRDIIEYGETSQERRESEEEKICGEFAGEVMLDGRADELVEMCVGATRGKVPLLTSVLPKIAAQENVAVGALANHMAFRLWQEGIANWWGAAANLQKANTELWLIARDTFLQNADFETLSQIDRDLLQQALSSIED